MQDEVEALALETEFDGHAHHGHGHHGEDGHGSGLLALAVLFHRIPIGLAIWWLVARKGQVKRAVSILLLIALGFVAIGVPIGGDYFQVWPQVMLFNGIVWLGSGVVTLCCYLRHAKPEPSAASSASAE